MYVDISNVVQFWPGHFGNLKANIQYATKYSTFHMLDTYILSMECYFALVFIENMNDRNKDGWDTQDTYWTYDDGFIISGDSCSGKWQDKLSKIHYLVITFFFYLQIN